MTDRVHMTLDRIHIAGLSSATLGPAAPFSIHALRVPTVEPTPEHKPLTGANTQTHGRYVDTIDCYGNTATQNHSFISESTRVRFPSRASSLVILSAC